MALTFKLDQYRTKTVEGNIIYECANGSLLIKCEPPLSTVWSYYRKTDSVQPGDPSQPIYWSHSRQGTGGVHFQISLKIQKVMRCYVTKLLQQVSLEYSHACSFSCCYGLRPHYKGGWGCCDTLTYSLLSGPLRKRALFGGWWGMGWLQAMLRS